jgi:hypothetical protein
MGGACSTYEKEKFIQRVDERTVGIRKIIKT